MKSFIKLLGVFAVLFIKTNLVISQDFGKNYKIIEFSYCYDSVEFSSKNPDYSIWRMMPLDSLINLGDSLSIHFKLPDIKSCKGYGRIRFKLYTDSLAISKLWQLHFTGLPVPYEFYFNRRLIFSTGIVSSDIKKEKVFSKKNIFQYQFIINTDTNQIEIKFSLLKRLKDYGEDYYNRFIISVYPKKGDLMSEKIDLLKKEIGMSWYSMFFFTMFVIFFIIFLMYRKFLNYLYFSLFNLFISITIFCRTSVFYFVSQNSIIAFLGVLSLIMVINFMLFLPVNMFFPESKKLKKAIYSTNVLLVIFYMVLMLLPKRIDTSTVILIILLLSIIFSIIISIRGIRKKKSGAKIIGLGLIFPFCYPVLFLIIFLVFSIFKIDIGHNFLLSWGISTASIPISMAIYLAREMMLNNKSLEKQIVEIRMLSEENIAREKEKQKMIAEQNIILEIQVLERTSEIEQQKKEIEAKRDLVTRQKEHIEDIHKEVTDSINYARRLQTSALPNLKILDDYFSDSFLLFKPKDVVSGDFYWFAKVENQIIVTVADCTGHGVPGAFMSMLGMSLLKEIVINEYITQPDIILKRLRKEVIKALGQTGETGEQKDGMDLSLCSINLETLEMQWSGANNPCLIILDGKILELKGDKMPIAIYDKMDKFSLHKLQLQKNDLIYLYSDGYPDQFGGPDNKKFMSTRLKELLLIASGNSMADQKELLDKTIEDWKNSHETRYEQTDDITVMGLRI
jgi:serine phosphatase RsbU (regulator of sigma subunit)